MYGRLLVKTIFLIVCNIYDLTIKCTEHKIEKKLSFTLLRPDYLPSLKCSYCFLTYFLSSLSNGPSKHLTLSLTLSFSLSLLLLLSHSLFIWQQIPKNLQLYFIFNSSSSAASHCCKDDHNTTTTAIRP